MTFCLVAGAVWIARADGSPFRLGGAATRSLLGWLFLAVLASAFVAYMVGTLTLMRERVGLVFVLTVAAAIQLVPLAGPILLSRDAYSYAAYGRIDATLGGNPYHDAPALYPTDPVTAEVSPPWRQTTSVYGPAFTLVSDGVALVARDDPQIATFLFRAIAAVSVIALAVIAAALASDRATAAAFVGWNPLLAIHSGGGGHNDAMMIALVLGGMLAHRRGRRLLGGVLWSSAVLVKWIPVVLYPLWTLTARRLRTPTGLVTAATALVALGTAATWRYGMDWLRIAIPLAHTAQAGSRFALVQRLHDIGVGRDTAFVLIGGTFTAGALLLVRRARQGKSTLALAACLLLVATPWLLPWYVVWAVGLAAVEGGNARWLTLGLVAYLLPYRMPL